MCCYLLQVLNCSGDPNTHSLCAKCVVAWLCSKTGAENTFNYKCPLYNECNAEFDPELVFDIALQLADEDTNINVEFLKSNEISAAVREEVKVYCPNCPYFYIEDGLQDCFVDLFAECPVCQASFCLTCRHSLSQHGYRDHVCAVDSFKTVERIRHELAEVLTNATLFRCRSCKQSSTPGTKRKGDCNVIKCSRCSNNYCYICSKDLGLENEGAHQDFPHKNDSIPDAPWCWLVDTEDQNIDEAINMKKIDNVIKYFSGLKISHREKQKMIACCADLLGNIQDRVSQRIGDTKEWTFIRFLRLLKRRIS